MTPLTSPFTTIRFLASIGAIFLVSACTTVVDTPAPVATEFEQRADLVRFKKPSWNFDSKYNKQLLDFQIIDADTSARKSKSKLEYVPGEKPDFFEWLLFDEHVLSSIKQHRITHFQEFRFNIKNQTGSIARTNCQISSLEYAAAEHHDHHENNRDTYQRSHFDSGDRFETFLACHVSQFGDVTRFSVHKEREAWSLKIDQSTKPLRFDSVIRDSMMVKHSNGLVEEQALPPWARELDGIAIYHNDKQEAQISFDQNHSSIWLSKSATPQIRELMAAMAYSIVLFDWLDDDWKD